MAAGPLAGAVLLMLLSGCASGGATVAAPGDGGVARAGARTATDVPADPCAFVDAADASLYVALADWRTSAGEQAGRAVCQHQTDGYLVTAVTTVLAADAQPPPGLCAPPGSAPIAAAGDLLCSYAGPGQDTVTAVVAGARLAVGVRVVGPEAGRAAAALARHAGTHL